MKNLVVSEYKLVEADNMAEASWKDKITERWQPRSPHTVQEDLTLERILMPKPLTEVIKEDIHYTMNIETEAPPEIQPSEEKKCQNSKLK